MSPSKERFCYHNGKYLPESEVLISFRDRGFVLGDAVFDAARTFGGKIFKLEEHIERLYRSLKAVDIDPGLTPGEMKLISEELVERNLPLLEEGGDYWVLQRVSRGMNVVGGELWESTGPTVIVECSPLPLKARARLFHEGIDLQIPLIRRIPPECLSPNVKSHNYLNLVLADLEVREQSDNAWAILLDTRGFLCEGIGSNVFLVSEGELRTPRSQYVLAGVSRQTVIELAEDLGFTVIEDDLSHYDALNADEAFITSTSFCICPVRRCNGRRIGAGPVPGPVTQRLQQAFAEKVGFDFTDQYLRHLSLK